MNTDPGRLHHRLDVALRLLAATGGGYLLATLFALALARIVPLPSEDGLRLGGMLSFIVFTLAAIWAFSVRRQRRIWQGIAAACLVCSAILTVLPEANT